MNRHIIAAAFSAALCCTPVSAKIYTGLDSIQSTLQQSSTQLVQEKVYIHTDNTCYFVGDTLWYKAYVLRADNLHFTDMSKILYVELLSPDGLVVERQNIIVSDKGYTNGNFVLTDSLYSGFYELRAYTKWMLNFNVKEHRYSRFDAERFYNFAMARDYYRMWDGLYSRVLPIYSKPDTPGDYSARRMYQRPKQRLDKPLPTNLQASFYPEGGWLIEGLPCRVAYELTDQNGQAINSNIQGMITADKETIASIQPSYMGRGSFTVTPQKDKKLKAVIQWNGKNYTYNLPETLSQGLTLQMLTEEPDAINKKFSISSRLSANTRIGISVLCRGALKYYTTTTLNPQGSVEINIPTAQLPTGINNITLFNEEGKVLADRLFFVNHHDYEDGIINVSEHKTTLDPYEKVDLNLQVAKTTQPVIVSVAIRDTQTDDASYNDGNIMTDLLLSSDLKGFIANPAYYFEANDNTHHKALDLLMMVQGWRKYNWQELADTTFLTRRYQPEKGMTIEGSVYKMLSFNEVTQDEVGQWIKGTGSTGYKFNEPSTEEQTAENTDQPQDNNNNATTFASDNEKETIGADHTNSDNSNAENIEYGDITSADSYMGVNHSNLRHEVLTEAEITVDNKSVGGIQETKEGKFTFSVPPFYGDATLFLRAYSKKDSVKRCMASTTDTHVLDEDWYADYYVKRDLFYPIFANKYNYYQNHIPDYQIPLIDEEKSSLSMENDNHMLKNVTVKGKRQGRRAIDYKKPAYVADAYELYNLVTDYGLSFGKLNFRQFPYQVATFLYGNMGRHISFNVDARIDNRIFYRSYAPDPQMPTLTDQWRAEGAIFKDLKLKRLDEIRFFTDYEPRNEDAPYEQDRMRADVTVDFKTMNDDAERYTYRDRRYILHGFTYPDEFYHPNYSNRPTTEVKDYRRTLYWNPNALTDANGNLALSFYNNAKQTRIKISAAGISPDGKILMTK